MFEAAGLGEPSNGGARNALQEFQKTIVSRGAPIDTGNLSAAAECGRLIFEGKGNCTACHSGPRYTEDRAHNSGVPPYPGWEDDPIAQITVRYEIYAKGATEEMYRTIKDDPGLYFRPKQKSDMGKFRTPSLRYTAYTYP